MFGTLFKRAIFTAAFTAMAWQVTAADSHTSKATYITDFESGKVLFAKDEEVLDEASLHG